MTRFEMKCIVCKRVIGFSNRGTYLTAKTPSDYRCIDCEFKSTSEYFQRLKSK